MKISLIYNPIFLAVVTGLALSLSACGGGGGSGSSGDNTVNKQKKEKNTPTVPAKKTSTSSGEKGCGSLTKEEMLKKVNELRNQSRFCHKEKKNFSATHALKWNNTLEKSTKKFANDMAKHDYYNYFGGDAHVQPDTSKPKPWKIKDAITFNDRSTEFGYFVPEKIVGTGGENLARSISDKRLNVKTAVDTAYDDWLKSTHGHCESIMEPKFEDFAMSCSYNAKTHRYYFVQMFGVQCKSVDECEKKGIQ